MEPVKTPPSGTPRSRNRLNSTIVAAAAAVALTLAGLGIAGAQTEPSTTTPDTAAPSPGAQADRPPGTARHHGPGRHRHRGVKAGLATAARTIGISEADLRTALRSGQSIADVAKSKNVEVQKVIDALVAEAEKNLAERITAFVNRAGPGPDRDRRGNFRGHRPGEEAPTRAPAATNA